jgi:signal transduction histidine kinase/DNA-binding response OmpR family regulator
MPMTAPLILFVDAAPDYLDAMRATLEARYDIAVARGAAQALAAARERLPEVILGERGALDGELRQTLRDDPALRDIPVIAMLTGGQPGAAIGEADDYIDKPFSSRDLIGRIEVNRRAAQRRRDAARREAELRKEGEAIVRRVNIVLTHLPFGLTMANPEGKIIYANPARDKLLRFKDYDRKAGDNLADRLPAFHPDGTPLTPDEYPIRRALKGELVTDVEIRYDYGNGAHRWINASGIPIHGPDGELQYAIGVAIDISGEMQARHELLQLTETLEERVRSEIEERLKAEEALRQIQKLQAIGQLTGGIAHDFNNLLQVLLGNLDAAERQLGGDRQPDLARVHRQVTASLRSAERAAQLTRQLLAFARRQPLDPTPTDVNKLVLGMTELLRRTLGESIAIETAIDPGLDFAFADRNQLESALLNLAVNARDAMPGGGGLTIETANCSFDAAAVRRWEEFSVGDYVMIAVTDTGTGIPPEVLPHILEPFFTTKEVGQGTGLGLSQVYGFAKQSGGHVQIYSEVGVGTTVKVYLPAQPAPDAAESLDAPAPERRASTGDVVLIVEDDPDVRDYSGEMLRELGYETLEAPDAATALRQLEADPRIRLMFTDVGLPGMNGKQLADAAKARWPKLKILFTTGYARNAIVHHGRLDPGVELITKPFTTAALALKLRDLLEAE